MTDLPEEAPKPEQVRIVLRGGALSFVDINIFVPDDQAWAIWLRGIKLDGYIMATGLYIPYEWIACIQRLAAPVEGGNVVKLH